MDNLSQALSDKLSISKEETPLPSPPAAADKPLTASAKPHKPDPASIPSIVPAEQHLWCQTFRRNRKMMVGTITATSPLPTVGVTKLTYDTHRHIIEQFLTYADTSTLLAFRATCRRLRDRVDLLFESHIELHTEGLQLVFETPAKRVIKGQRIPRFCNPALHNIRLDIRPTMADYALLQENRFDHRLANFSVHHSVADWFAQFLKNIKVLDFHGGVWMNIFPGAKPRDGPDALGEVTVKSVKIPRLRFFPEGSETGYAAAVPFSADAVEYHSHLHLLDETVQGSWFFWPKWIPECREVEHYVNLRIGQAFDVTVDKVLPFVYPPTVKRVAVFFNVVGAPDPEDPRFRTSTAEERIVPYRSLMIIIQRICGAFQPGIKWEFHGTQNAHVRNDKKDGSEEIIPAEEVPHLINMFLIRIYAAWDNVELKTAEDFQRKGDELRGRIEHHL